jgi:hypothetical protein
VLFGGAIQDRLAYTFTTAPGAERHALMPQSVDYRLELWTEQFLPALHNHWLTGYGPLLPPHISFEYTESLYLTLLFRGGVVLLLVYAGLMVALGAIAWRAARSRAPARRLAGRVTFLLVGLLAVMHLMEPYFTTSGLPHLVWILAALVTLPRGRS